MLHWERFRVYKKYIELYCSRWELRCQTGGSGVCCIPSNPQTPKRNKSIRGHHILKHKCHVNSFAIMQTCRHGLFLDNCVFSLYMYIYIYIYTSLCATRCVKFHCRFLRLCSIYRFTRLGLWFLFITGNGNQIRMVLLHAWTTTS